MGLILYIRAVKLAHHFVVGPLQPLTVATLLLLLLLILSSPGQGRAGHVYLCLASRGLPCPCLFTKITKGFLLYLLQPKQTIKWCHFACLDCTFLLLVCTTHGCFNYPILIPLCQLYFFSHFSKLMFIKLWPRFDDSQQT